MIAILVIDDDYELGALLGEYLQPEGFAVEAVTSASQGVERALSGAHELVVLDVMLPEISGFEVLRQIRTKSAIPVIMLTARGEEIDRIVGLEMGADDYLPKPFNPRELVARLRAIHRRTAPAERSSQDPPPEAPLTVGDLYLDPATRRVSKGNREIILTSVEFSLLRELLLQAGRVMSRERLAETVLGRRLAPFDRSIDVHISSLRKKLDAPAGGQDRIKAIRGVGYFYAPIDLGKKARKSSSRSGREEG